MSQPSVLAPPQIIRWPWSRKRPAIKTGPNESAPIAKKCGSCGEFFLKTVLTPVMFEMTSLYDDEHDQVETRAVCSRCLADLSATRRGG